MSILTPCADCMLHLPKHDLQIGVGLPERLVLGLQLMRRPLEKAGQDVQMVESLGPMWEEERIRIGHSPPDPPPAPERHPEPLCAYVEHIRAQFQVGHACT